MIKGFIVLHRPKPHNSQDQPWAQVWALGNWNLKLRELGLKLREVGWQQTMDLVKQEQGPILKGFDKDEKNKRVLSQLFDVEEELKNGN